MVWSRLKCPLLVLGLYLLITEKSQSVLAHPATGSVTNSWAAHWWCRTTASLTDGTGAWLCSLIPEEHCLARGSCRNTVLCIHRAGALSHSPVVLELHFLSEDQDSSVLAALVSACWLLGKVLKPLRCVESLLDQSSNWKWILCLQAQWHLQCSIITYLPSNSSLEHHCLATSCPVSCGFHLQKDLHGKWGRDKSAQHNYKYLIETDVWDLTGWGKQMWINSWIGIQVWTYWNIKIMV